MKSIRPICFSLLAGLAISLSASSIEAQLLFVPQNAISEPTWYPYVIARGADRMIIENTPIEQRPYRPMHFYGNTVRRTYYRGTPLPTNFSRGGFTLRRR